MNQSAPALFVPEKMYKSVNELRRSNCEEDPDPDFPRDDLTTRSRETRSTTTDSSLDITNVFPCLHDNVQSKFQSEAVGEDSIINQKLNGITEVPLQDSPSGGNREYRRRRRSVGGDDPGIMYRRARARSRSPTSDMGSSVGSNDLGALYQRAVNARSRSPSPHELLPGDELSKLLRLASVGRASSPMPDLSRLDSGNRSNAAAKVSSHSIESEIGSGSLESNKKSLENGEGAMKDPKLNPNLNEIVEKKSRPSNIRQDLGQLVSQELVVALGLVPEKNIFGDDAIFARLL